jgi:predicted RNase H-like HicB family nuclease
MLLTAVLIPAGEGGFTALNPETGTTSQGDSIESAIANLREATEIYLEEFPLVARPASHSSPPSMSRSMGSLPRVSGSEVTRALERARFCSCATARA